MFHHLTGTPLPVCLQIVMTALRGKQAELAEVLGKLAALDADLQDKTSRKEALEAEVELCKVKLDRWVLCEGLHHVPLPPGICCTKHVLCKHSLS
jgi:hypothetical protein